MANTINEGSDRIQVAVAIVVCEERALLIRRTSEHGGNWTFPGGKIESGENAMDAASRELNEEVSVQCRPVRTIGWRIHPDTGVGISYVLFSALQRKASIKERDKFSDLAWCTIEDLEKRTRHTLFSKVKAAISKTLITAK